MNPFELSIYIKSIDCIEDTAHIPSYANVEVAGWGSQRYFTTYETPIPSPILKETTLMILPHFDCKIRLATYRIDFYANQICTFPRYQLTNTAQVNISFTLKLGLLRLGSDFDWLLTG